MSLVKGGDAFHRMNFLYQVANKVLEQDPSAGKVASFYGHVLHMISRRVQAKLDPSIKRSLCKKCSVLLFPGVTCTERLRASPGRGQRLVVTCLHCGTIKRFPTRRGYELWYDKAEALGNQAIAATKDSAAKGSTASTANTASTKGDTPTATASS
ncbi:ribonuclease P protein subunit p21 [Rhipicephalus sanguineus]|uniref:ribonuclease P protein subunit p21 n=1 Tax=Rhipicephalus sanguineus TaxID=34632 RepID=UPI0018948EF6|nr:ribonuclease P protein subunit p21 [Rhipicephalus sanguineus]